MPPVRRSILTNLAYLFSSRVALRIFTVVYTITFARILGPEKLGIYSFSLSLAGLCLIFVDYGIGQVLLRDLSSDLKGAWEKLCIGLTLKTFLLLPGILIYGFLLYCFGGADNAFLSAMILLGSARLLQTLDTAIGNAFTAAERMDLKFIVTVVNSLLQAIGGATLILLGFDLLALGIWLLIVNVSSFFVSLYLASIHLYQIRWIAKGSKMLDLLRESWPYGGSSLLDRINTNIDSIVVAQVIGMEMNGVYAIARRVYRLLLMAVSMVKTVLFPRLSRLYNQDFETYASVYSSLFRLVGVLGICFLFFNSLFVDTYVPLLFGEEYLQACPVIFVFSLVTCVMNWQHIVGSSVLISRNRKAYSLPVILGSLTNIALNFTLVHPFGIIGVAWASLIAAWVLLLGWIILEKKHDGLMPADVLKIIIFQVICTLAVVLHLHLAWSQLSLVIFTGVVLGMWIAMVIWRGDLKSIRSKILHSS
jgi:O-antigen/teichoic acid export membrane protein